jgi:DNA polymerase-1
MIELAEVVRAALGDSRANIDSPPKLLRSLKQAGIEVTSTSRWELAQHEHPAVEPLLRYKKMSRLLAANGWNWIDEWVRDGRYRPVYVPGGVVTGRWASSGGGALQLPRQLRPVLRADPGWLLVSADVAQLEPRVLAAMSGDRAMADAGRGKDLYAGVVASGAVSTRDEAKIAVLGAMYGATTGDSGRLVPRLRKGFPAAMRLVDDAAAVGEHGGSVTTWLGRTSPPPGPGWIETQAAASAPNANAPDENRARRVAREFGRFTRNFVVQGTAAEWALVWIAELRTRLAALGETSEAPPADASGVVFARRPHLVFFLHDEIIVHTPAELAPQVVVAVEDSARVAGQRMFGAAPVDFPLDLRVSERAEKG